MPYVPVTCIPVWLMWLPLRVAATAISIYPMAVRDVSRTFWQLTGTFFQAYLQTCFML